MDCIGVGEAMLMLVPKAAREKYPALGEAARKSSGIPVVLATWRSAIFPPTRSTSSSAWVSAPAARKKACRLVLQQNSYQT